MPKFKDASSVGYLDIFFSFRWDEDKAAASLHIIVPPEWVADSCTEKQQNEY